MATAVAVSPSQGGQPPIPGRTKAAIFLMGVGDELSAVGNTVGNMVDSTDDVREQYVDFNGVASSAAGSVLDVIRYDMFGGMF